MIRLNKGPKPPILVAREDEWTRRYVDHVRNGTAITEADKTRFRHPDIKGAVRAESHEKCAYCESKVTAVYPGDCEHILPKRHRPELVVRWDNLTFSCRICNSNKGDYYSEREPLLNPYENEPADHLQFLGPMVVHKIGSALGERTVLRLRLSRGELMERRKERLESLKTLMDKWSAMPSSERKDLVEQQIHEELRANREYSAASRAFALAYAGIRDPSEEDWSLPPA